VKKAIKIVAASVGAGFLVGAGFRLGEALSGDRKPGKPASRPAFENAKTSEKIQAAFEDRLARLEREVVSQSSGLSELRECSLRTEHSMQKLLLSIDRLITHNRGVAPPDQGDRYPAAQDAIS
jgi:hypothetical protein